MGRKKKLDLLNTRLQLPESVRVVDSLDHRRYDPIYLNDGGVHIPFTSKPKKQESDYMAWKRGRIKGGGTADAPIIDSRGKFYEVGKAVELGPATVLISNRVYNENDYRENETARIYYCQKKRINTPAMNRVMDNTHEVVTETLAGRVEKGIVPGGSWTTTARLPSSPFSPVGPGHYNPDAFEAKYGPGSSNLLQFLSAASGRDSDEHRRLTKAERQRSRKLLTAGGGDGTGNNTARSRSRSPSPPHRAQTSDAAGFSSFDQPFSPVRPPTGFGTSDRWKSPLYRQENYTKTTGAKLAPDYDVALRERERVPPKFTTMPQRYEPKRDKVDIEVTVDWGPKASIATAARDSPLKYSMAFRSKAPVGMEIPLPTSPPHIGPGCFSVPPGLVVKNPQTPSIPFLKLPESVKEVEEQLGSYEQVRPFSETHSSGPVFSRAGSGAGLFLKVKVERQIKTIYPRLANTLWPQPKVEKIDPWKHLRPKIK